MMLDDNDAVAFLNESVECVEQFLYVVEMQTCRRLVEDEQLGPVAVAFAEERSQLDALRLAAAERAAALTQRQITQSDLL